MIRWPSKPPADEIFVSFDFSALPGPIDSANVSVMVVGGIDPQANDILRGAPTIDGTKVLQLVGGGISLVDYFLECRVQTAGQNVSTSALLPVRSQAIQQAPGESSGYLTEADYRRRFGDELDGLLREGHSFQQIQTEAASMIDSYVGQRYPLPLPVVPEMLRALAADITRYRLWSDEAPAEARRRFEDAQTLLRDISKGVVSLPMPGTPEAPNQIEFGSFRAPQVFTAKALEGF